METSKMTIDTLLLAARYIEEQDLEMRQSRSPPISPQPQSLPPPPPPTILQQQQQQQVQHHVLQQPVQLQHVTIQHSMPSLQQQPQAAQIQPTNGNITTLTTQQVNNLRKKDVPHVQMNRVTTTFMNSFDIMNQPVIDQGSGEIKRKQPPMAFRTGTREVHNKLEKNRRKHLKECFDILYAQLPNSRGNKKTSNLNILGSAIKFINSLKEHEQKHEKEMEQLAKEKITLQQKLVSLKKDIMSMYDVDDLSLIMPDLKNDDNARLRESTKMDDYIKPRLDPLTTVAVKPEVKEVMNNINNTPVTTASVTVPMTGINNVLKLPKSIKGALPVVTTTATNGVKEETIQLQPATVTTPAAPTTTATVQQTLSVLPFSYQMNQNLVVQKVIMPKGITADLTQFTPQLTTHFITTQQPSLDGKVMPTIVNAQYVVKPLVVVSTPSRPS